MSIDPTTTPTAEGTHRRGLGTFAGVFTPSILTILGIILFLRTGYVVGNGGLSGALAILAIATAVSVLTSISLAAIATNIDVKGGGDYYLISRTLGLEFGGAIGVVLFVAQSVSVAFYAIGFAEATASIAGWDSRLLTQIVAAVAVLLLFAFAWAGADVATKLQFVIMVLLGAALVSFFVGAVGAFDAGTFADSWTPAPGAIGFWAAFAVFFPAVTGFTQGVSMSGDLEDAGRSLPVGTFLAVGVSTVVYVAVMILLAGGVPLSELVGDGGEAMRTLAIVGAAVGVGVIAATLSSAMASLLGGPRILQSLAADRIFPILNSFGRGHGEANNPRRATLLSLVIAFITIGLGSVNLIAPVVSMFFLISYGLINYATYFEARAASPSFRPRFRFFSKWASLAGALLCAATMLLINPIAGAAAILALVAIYQYLSRRAIPNRWADASESHHFQRAVESVRAMEKELQHPRNWRPQILVFSAEPSRRERLLQFAKWVEGNSGLTAAFRIVTGEGIRKRIEADAEQEELAREIDELGLNVYARAVLASDGFAALPVIVQSFGVGKLRSNVALFGWPESDDPTRTEFYVRTIREVARLGVSVMSLSTDEARWQRFLDTPPKDRRIDVWWEDTDSGRLAVLAAYLCTRNEEWRSARIRLVATPSGNPAVLKDELSSMLYEARIDADVTILPAPTRGELIEATQDATLVLTPMHLRRGTIVDPLDTDMMGLVKRLPVSASFHAGSPMVLNTDPSSGIAEELAAAEEAYEVDAERVRKLESQLADAQARLESIDPSTDGSKASEAEESLDRIHRRVISARARAERSRWEADQVLATSQTGRQNRWDWIRRR
jgi:amino acid transporter